MRIFLCCFINLLFDDLVVNMVGCIVEQTLQYFTYLLLDLKTLNGLRLISNSFDNI